MGSVKFKRGQTFDFTGQLTNNGIPYTELAHCTLYADIRSIPNFEFIQHMRCTILDLVNATVQIYAAPTDTAKWLAMPHLIDVRLVRNDTGQILISNSVEIDVLDTVTEASIS